MNGIYVVMADNGVGEFLWHKADGNPIPVCGVNVYSLMDRGESDSIMSKGLFSDFCDWSELYLSSIPVLNDGEDFDWDVFNAKGIRLAQRLKVELGEAAGVRYVKPSDDPGRIRLEYLEVV